jgi:hypothetical protein
MNEKIRALAKRAITQYSPAYYSEKWTEKFAELIVRECIDICLSHRSCEGISDKIIADIKDRFRAEP